MIKNFDELTALLSDTKKESGEVISLCEYRKNKKYLHMRAKDIEELEKLQKYSEQGETSLFKILKVMDKKRHDNEKDLTTLQQIRFMFEHWYTIKDLIDKKLKQAKEDI